MFRQVRTSTVDDLWDDHFRCRVPRSQLGESATSVGCNVRRKKSAAAGVLMLFLYEGIVHPVVALLLGAIGVDLDGDGSHVRLRSRRRGRVSSSGSTEDCKTQLLIFFGRPVGLTSERDWRPGLLVSGMAHTDLSYPYIVLIETMCLQSLVVHWDRLYGR